VKKILYENKVDPFQISIAKSLGPTPHFHKDIEIVFVKDGQSFCFADRKKELIKNGDLFISFPNQIHYYEGSKIGEYLLVILSPDILFNLKDTMYEHIPKQNFLYNVSSIEPVKLMFKALEEKSDYSMTIQAGLLNQAMAMLLPYFGLKPRLKTNNTTLQEVLNYCSKYYYTELTLDDVAEALHVSKFHISHLLNSKLGIGFTSYLNTLRINNACDLLEDTDKKIADISEDVGFGSIRSFNRAFMQAMNMTPMQYRNQFKA
ncbi:MAG: AraC family transcriptional regulator, partial [Acutalibacteraceae bacterium]|jgi:AraC-like DNA-binding protein